MYEKEFQLPYDRCIEIDQEIDALLEEEKKKQQLNERKAKLIEESKKSRHFAIYRWLRWNLMLEYVCGRILWTILFVPLFLFYCTDETVCEKVVHIIAPSITDLIRTKMLKKNYMIPTNVIDCPIENKQRLYSWIKDKYYLTLKDGNLFLYDKDFDNEEQVTGQNKDDETQYFISQLEEDRYYSIIDIITDKQEKA